MSKYADLSKEELLRLIENQEQELKSKKYGLVWDNEKEPEQVVLDCENNLPILERIPKKEIKTDDGEDNILIEWDNYHALTVLNYTHKEKIDVIYIDPPYNTGNKDFVYNDRYVDKEDWYRHSKWLNFMEKRLNLAKRLLKESWLIFISIDDNEVAQLKLLCDKIFDWNTSKWGKTNFIACLPTIMNLKGNNDQFGFAGTHEYTLVYAKNIEKAKVNEFDIDEEEIWDKWEEDETWLYKKWAPLRATWTESHRENRPLMFYPILLNKKTGEISTIKNEEFENIYDKTNKSFNDDFLNNLQKKYEKMDYAFILPKVSENEFWRRRWGYNLKTLHKMKTEIIVNKVKDGTFSLYKKQRPEIGDLPSKKPKTLFYKPEYSSGNGTTLLKNMFNSKVFDNPKPLDLIKDILILSTNKKSIILDFMAWSWTTGHATLELNKLDNGNRKFILCTNNELNGVGSKLAEENPKRNLKELWICQRVTHPRLEKVINWYDSIEGTGGNLQYFQTNFIKKTSSRDQVKFDLTNKCTEMLCVKDNIFNLIKEDKNYKIFSSNNKKRFLCIYYSFMKDETDVFIKELKNIKEEKNIYMFSETKEVDLEIFKDIKNYNIEAIPEPILEIYRELVKMNISK